MFKNFRIFHFFVLFYALIPNISVGAENENYVFSYKRRYLQFKEKFQKSLVAVSAKQSTSDLERDSQILDAIVMSTSGDRVGNVVVENVHGDVTVMALKEYLSDECIDRLVEENIKQDRGKADEDPKNHFDDNLICQSWDVAKDRMSKLTKESETKEQLHFFGMILHAVQDFYSHSNYVEISLEESQKLVPDELELFDFDSFCNKKSDKIFTGTYKGDHGLGKHHITDEDLANPYSHLYWNKDFDPRENKELAKIYARSSLKKNNKGAGKFYFFDFVSSLQVRETRRIYQKIAKSVPSLNRSCKVK